MNEILCFGTQGYYVYVTEKVDNVLLAQLRTDPPKFFLVSYSTLKTDLLF